MLRDGAKAQDRLNDSPKVTGEVCSAARKLAQLPWGPATVLPAIKPPLLPIFYQHISQTVAARNSPWLQVMSSSEQQEDRDQQQEKPKRRLQGLGGLRGASPPTQASMPIVLLSLCWQRPARLTKPLQGSGQERQQPWEQTGLKPPSDGTRTSFSSSAGPFSALGGLWSILH